jgi:hypothetical protein
MSPKSSGSEQQGATPHKPAASTRRRLVRWLARVALPIATAGLGAGAAWYVSFYAGHTTPTLSLQSVDFDYKFPSRSEHEYPDTLLTITKDILEKDETSFFEYNLAPQTSLAEIKATNVVVGDDESNLTIMYASVQESLRNFVNLLENPSQGALAHYFLYAYSHSYVIEFMSFMDFHGADLGFPSKYRDLVFTDDVFRKVFGKHFDPLLGIRLGPSSYLSLDLLGSSNDAVRIRKPILLKLSALLADEQYGVLTDCFKKASKLADDQRRLDEDLRKSLVKLIAEKLPQYKMVKAHIRVLNQSEYPLTINSDGASVELGTGDHHDALTFAAGVAEYVPQVTDDKTKDAQAQGHPVLARPRLYDAVVVNPKESKVLEVVSAKPLGAQDLRLTSLRAGGVLEARVRVSVAPAPGVREHALLTDWAILRKDSPETSSPAESGSVQQQAAQ